LVYQTTDQDQTRQKAEQKSLPGPFLIEVKLSIIETIASIVEYQIDDCNRRPGQSEGCEGDCEEIPRSPSLVNGARS
jgi:hypothetical protein